MNHEEKKKITPPPSDLKDEGLEEVSGGDGYLVMCYCPTCNLRTPGLPGGRCLKCKLNGIESYLVES